MQNLDGVLNKVKIGLVAFSLLIALLFVVGALSLSLLIYYGLFLLSAVVLVSFGGAILNFVEQPGKGKNFLLGLGTLLLVFFISYGLSGANIDPKTQEVIAGSRLSQAGIYTLYFVIIAAIGTIVFSSVKRLIK